MPRYEHGYSVEHCLRCAKKWAGAPARYATEEWLRMAREAGDPDFTEVAGILDLLANTERRSVWLKDKEKQREKTLADLDELRRKAAQ